MLSICSLSQCRFNVFIKSRHLLDTHHMSGPPEGTGDAGANEAPALPSKSSSLVGEQRNRYWHPAREDRAWGKALKRAPRDMGVTFQDGRTRKEHQWEGKCNGRNEMQPARGSVFLMYGWQQPMLSVWAADSLNLGSRRSVASASGSVHGRALLVLHCTV